MFQIVMELFCCRRKILESAEAASKDGNVKKKSMKRLSAEEQ